MASVVNRIEDLGVEVEHIPGGVTSLTQPVDVGINKPMKNYVVRQWEDYMLEHGIKEAITKPPNRFVFANWILASQAQLTKAVIKNAWRHSPFSYYPLEKTVNNRSRREMECLPPPSRPLEESIDEALGLGDFAEEDDQQERLSISI
jgi:hypothetical protein